MAVINSVLDLLKLRGFDDSKHSINAWLFCVLLFLFRRELVKQAAHERNTDNPLVKQGGCTIMCAILPHEQQALVPPEDGMSLPKWRRL